MSRRPPPIRVNVASVCTLPELALSCVLFLLLWEVLAHAGAPGTAPVDVAFCEISEFSGAFVDANGYLPAVFVTMPHLRPSTSPRRSPAYPDQELLT